MRGNEESIRNQIGRLIDNCEEEIAFLFSEDFFNCIPIENLIKSQERDVEIRCFLSLPEIVFPKTLDLSEIAKEFERILTHGHHSRKYKKLLDSLDYLVLSAKAVFPTFPEFVNKLKMYLYLNPMDSYLFVSNLLSRKNMILSDYMAWGIGKVDNRYAIGIHLEAIVGEKKDEKFTVRTGDAEIELKKLVDKINEGLKSNLKQHSIITEYELKHMDIDLLKNTGSKKTFDIHSYKPLLSSKSSERVEKISSYGAKVSIGLPEGKCLLQLTDDMELGLPILPYAKM